MPLSPSSLVSGTTLPGADHETAKRHTTLRAYLTVLTLYGLVAGSPLIGALRAVAQLNGTSVPDWTRTVQGICWLASLVCASLWLAWLIRTHPHRMRRLVLLIGIGCVIAADEAGLLSPSHASTHVAGRLCEIVLWVWLCIEITARRGLTLQTLSMPRPFRRLSHRSDADRTRCIEWHYVFCRHVLALLAGGILAFLTTLLPGPALHADQQGAAAGVPDFWPGLIQGIWSAAIEEVLVTAAVVTILKAARRPLWEIVAVVAAMRALPHAYLGLGPVLAGLLPAAAAAWLYHRHQHVVPLIAAHTAHNTITLAVSAIGWPAVLPWLLFINVSARIAGKAAEGAQPTRPEDKN
ncbi:type II CAAX prenyl endopeptidase Rce1 family protein [Streptomyces sp. STCH 565 A]|uniref:CPBP family glutamic-type intramembrane protease n=1 Tax=Streptomyces sp. STCH 565 A TaxID=2950532 RepID=UPI002075731E|nr:CPBP family glutamic-type intramembrane protease [Streptomyces sp. STCH 565 A]MCM8555445.1 CPBP family glutamic-type intramembrane protease [Streptomyces sp. STCH 565 A]